MKFKDVVTSEASTEAKVAALALLLDKELIKLADTVLNVKKLEGPKGEQGLQGPKGEQGDRGFDGTNGKDGSDGKDGKDGEDGKQGVGVADAKIDFDGSLVITLTDGTEINAGDVVPLDTAEKIRVIGNGGGTSQSVLDAIASINAIIATYGTMALQNDTTVDINGGAIDGTSIGAAVPAAGTFTTLGVTTSINASGAGSNIDLNLASKGTGVVNVKDDSVTVAKFLYETSSDTSFWKFRSRAGDGFNVGVVADGTASNIGFNISTKGTAASRFFTGDNGAFTGGVEQARISHTASAVNYVQVTGAATNNAPTVSAQGSDSYVSLSVQSKSANLNLGTRLGGNPSLQILDSGASPANYFRITGAATTVSPILSAQGSDTNISQVFQSKGTGAIDLAAGSRGVNISNGGTVTALTRTALGTTYTSPPTITISAPTTAGGVQAAAVSRMQQAGATLVSGGTGYTVGDLITVVGGTLNSQPVRFQVTGVSAGVITTFDAFNLYGDYLTIPSNPISVTGGTGSGATFNVTWYAYAYNITNAGSGYVEQPTVSFSGGGGSGAAAYATVGSGTVVRSLGSVVDFTMPGGVSFRVGDAGATSAQYWQAIGGAFTGILRSTGSTQNGQIQTGGTGSIQFTTNNGAQEQLRVSHTASAVNYVQVTGAATGGAVKTSAQGSDTNIDYQIDGKGTGLVRFGTYTAGAPAATGYISIKSAAGVTYKVLVST